jgi:hypothetical protein
VPRLDERVISAVGFGLPAGRGREPVCATGFCGGLGADLAKQCRNIGPENAADPAGGVWKIGHDAPDESGFPDQAFHKLSICLYKLTKLHEIFQR